jgi:hypothetical protein
MTVVVRRRASSGSHPRNRKSANRSARLDSLFARCDVNLEHQLVELAGKPERHLVIAIVHRGAAPLSTRSNALEQSGEPGTNLSISGSNQYDLRINLRRMEAIGLMNYHPWHLIEKAPCAARLLAPDASDGPLSRAPNGGSKMTDAFSDSYVSRVLFATPAPAHGRDAVARRWRASSAVFARMASSTTNRESAERYRAFALGYLAKAEKLEPRDGCDVGTLEPR